jgi:hypothetical protein
MDPIPETISFCSEPESSRNLSLIPLTLALSQPGEGTRNSLDFMPLPSRERELSHTNSAIVYSGKKE